MGKDYLAPPSSDISIHYTTRTRGNSAVQKGKNRVAFGPLGKWWTIDCAPSSRARAKIKASAALDVTVPIERALPVSMLPSPFSLATRTIVRETRGKIDKSRCCSAPSLVFAEAAACLLSRAKSRSLSVRHVAAPPLLGLIIIIIILHQSFCFSSL